MASDKKQADATDYFKCLDKAGGSNKYWPQWRLEQIKDQFTDAIVKQGQTYCKETKAKLDTEETPANAKALVDCYNGVLKGGSATIVIVVLVALAAVIGGGIYCYNNSNKGETDDHFKPEEDAKADEEEE